MVETALRGQKSLPLPLFTQQITHWTGNEPVALPCDAGD